MCTIQDYSGAFRTILYSQMRDTQTVLPLLNLRLLGIASELINIMYNLHINAVATAPSLLGKPCEMWSKKVDLFRAPQRLQLACNLTLDLVSSWQSRDLPAL